MNRRMLSPINFFALGVALMLLLAHTPSKLNAQIDAGRLRKAAQDKVTKDEKPSQSSSPGLPERNVFQSVSSEQANIAKKNRMVIKEKIESVFDIQEKEGGSAYLTFTTDYSKPDESPESFSGKDFIYAKLNTSKPLTEVLPKADESSLEYYRVRLTARTDNGSVSSDNKLSKREYFNFAYGNSELLIPIIPEKGFFEAIAQNYRDGANFKSLDAEYDAYTDILTRTFPSEIADLLSNLPKGDNRVEMELSVLAKKRGSEFVEVKNIKGVFKLTVDDEAKQRFTDIHAMMPELNREYSSLQTIASQKKFARSEDAMLEKMTPRERERYLIAKSSSGGYMAAYGGKKYNIRFIFDEHRTKSAHIDIRWPDGPCETCENGTGTAYFSDQAGATYEVPEGARITFNGRVLITSVSQDDTVKIYWYY